MSIVTREYISCVRSRHSRFIILPLLPTRHFTLFFTSSFSSTSLLPVIFHFLFFRRRLSSYWGVVSTPCMESGQVPSSNAGQGSQCRPIGLSRYVGPSAIPRKFPAILGTERLTQGCSLIKFEIWHLSQSLGGLLYLWMEMKISLQQSLALFNYIVRTFSYWCFSILASYKTYSLYIVYCIIRLQGILDLHFCLSVMAAFVYLLLL